MRTRFFLVPVLLGCWSVSACARADGPAAENDIREAAFRYQFAHNISSLQNHAAFYFLEIGPKFTDPSEEFLKRFKDFKPVVKKASESRCDENSQIIDKTTGKLGLIFYTNDIKWLSPSKAQIDAGYAEANLSAGSNTYIMEKKDNQWVVSEDIKGPVA